MLGNGWTYLILGRTERSVDHYTRAGSKDDPSVLP